MIQYRKILELYHEQMSQRTIAASTAHSRNTVSEVIKRSNEKGIGGLTDEMDDKWLEEYLFPELVPAQKGYEVPDFEYIHKELMKKSVTLHLLHHEYEMQCRSSHKVPYAYRTFCEQYNKYAKKYKATLPIRRKPAEIMEVDWAGTNLFIKDKITGEDIKAYLFVATLPYSQYSYVEAFLDMKQNSWLKGHINAYKYFGGVTEILVPDNLKTGVIKSDRSEPELNLAYQELAEHYETVIVPARVRAPKDKASVEGFVGHASRNIIAALRNYQCFDLETLNKQVWKMLDILNNSPFQKKPGTRKKAYEEEEKLHLKSLPHEPFKFSQWRKAKVHSDYHIQVERMFYSVPFEYIQSEVDVRLTQDLVEVYFNNTRIASHKRLKGEFGQRSTQRNHLTDNHLRYLEHTPDSCLKWSANVGIAMGEFVKFLIEASPQKKVMKQLMSLKSAAQRYSNVELEKAASDLLRVTKTPTVKMFKTILSRNKSNHNKQTGAPESTVQKDYGFTRGANYFGGEE